MTLARFKVLTSGHYGESLKETTVTSVFLAGPNM